MAANASLAPPASFVSGATPLLAAALLALWSSGALVVALTVSLGGLSGPAQAVLVLLLGAGAAASWRFWRGQTPQRLAWDGGNWLLTDPGVAPDPRRHAVHVVVALDLQLALLLRSRTVAPSGRSSWLWLQRADDPHRWHALRCALFAAPGHA